MILKGLLAIINRFQFYHSCAPKSQIAITKYLLVALLIAVFDLVQVVDGQCQQLGVREALNAEIPLELRLVVDPFGLRNINNILLLHVHHVWEYLQ